MASITQRGPNSWRVLIRRAGSKSICKTFKTEAQAKAFVIEQDGEQPDGLTVGEVVQAYRKLREDSRKPIPRNSNNHYMLAHLERDLGDVRMSALSVPRLIDWARLRASEGAGGYTINMELSKLSTVLKYGAVSLKRVLRDVPMEARPSLTHLGLIGSANSRTRRLEGDEQARVLGYAPGWMRDVIMFALQTAMRREEITRLLWSDIDHDRKLILIRDRKDPRDKVGNHQWVPLLGTSYQLICEQEHHGDRPFPYTPEKISDHFKLICDALGIQNLRFHDLRHEAISRLFEMGFTVEQVALVSGHKDWRNLRRYTQLRPESLHAIETDLGNQPRPRSAPRVAPRRSGSGSGKSRR